MTTLEKELENARKRWVEAKKKNDQILMSLWERVGKSIKARIAERIGKPIEEVTDTLIENIFGQPLDKA